MDNQNLAKFYEHQISFTEWFSRINHPYTETMREEDNLKRERLKVLNESIGLPFDKPVQFSARSIADRAPDFILYLENHGQDLCALRLIPLKKELPKLRIRGSSVRLSLEWFAKQNINPDLYHADFVPHAEESEWSTIFVVNEQGVFGEIIAGGHYQLTQGFYAAARPILFSYNFTKWELSENNSEALAHLQQIVEKITVQKEKQAEIATMLSASFVQNLLCGYFETTSSQEYGLWFVDYNRILGNMYCHFKLNLNHSENKNTFRGHGTSPGKVVGRVKIIPVNLARDAILSRGEILVTQMTTPEFVPLMKEAGAIITDLGGVLTHAAIVSRELGIPCITGTRDATLKLKEGDMVEVDADNGVIRKL